MKRMLLISFVVPNSEMLIVIWIMAGYKCALVNVTNISNFWCFLCAIHSDTQGDFSNTTVALEQINKWPCHDSLENLGVFVSKILIQ